MNKKATLLSFLFFLCSFSYGQSVSLDSALAQSKRLDQSEDYDQSLKLAKYAMDGFDSEGKTVNYNKAKIFYISALMEFDKFDQSIRLLSEIIETPPSKKYNYDTLKAKAYHYTGYCFGFKGNYKTQLEYYKKAYKLRYGLFGDYHDETSSCLNNLGYCYGKLGEYDKQKEYFEKCLKIRLKLFGENHSDVGRSYNNLGSCMGRLGNYKKEIAYYYKALEIREKVHGKLHPAVCKTYNNIGYSYFNQGNYVEAQSAFEKALYIYNNSKNFSAKQLSIIYGNLAAISSQMGELEQSILYNKKAIYLDIESVGKDHPNLSHQYNALSMLYNRMGKYNEADSFVREAIRIREKSYGINNTQTATLYFSLAQNLINQNHYDEATLQINKALSVHERQLDKNHPQLADAYAIAGDAFIQMKQYRLAEKILKEALQKIISAYGPYNLFTESVYNSLANLYYQTQQYTESIDYAQQCLTSIENNTDYAQLKPLKFSESQTYALEILGKSYLKIFNQTKDKNTLDKAISSLNASIEIIDVARNRVLFQNSKKHLSKVNYQTFQYICDAYYQQYLLDKSYVNSNLLFRAIQNCKYFVLRNRITNSRQYQFHNVPLDIIAKENFFSNKIKQKQKEAITKKNNEKGESLFETIKEYEHFLTTLKKDYPKYYNAKYKAPLYDLETVQKGLNTNTSLIEYIYLPGKILICLMNKKEFIAKEVTNIDSLNKSIKHINQTVSKNPATNSSTYDAQRFVKESKYCYTQLIKPLEEYISQTKNLIIVPDKTIALLSFDVLIKKSNKDQSGNLKNTNFLIENYLLSYGYSTAVLYELWKNKNQGNGKFLLFSPSFDKQKASELHYKDKEYNSLIKKFTGDLFFDTLATKSNFIIESAQGYSILHLLTHTHVNTNQNEESSLLFYSEKLKIKEIYNLKLNADLVILSACETGAGEYSNGTGLESLSSAFTYAGCNAVMMNLWEASDQSSSEIINQFYQYIGEEYSSSEALQKAKLDYLKKSDVLKSHPFYWANLSLIGNTNSIGLTPKPSYLPWLFILAAILASLYFLYKARKLFIK